MKFSLSRLHLRAISAAALLLFGAAGAFAQGAGGRGGGGGGGITIGGGGGGGGGGGAAGGGSSTNGNRTYQNSTLVGDATITSDVDTRRIIVVTDDATNENIKKVIASLDAPKPQVLINVVFLQVTHENDLDLGAEATYVGPVAINTNPTGTATTKFGVAGQFADPGSISTAYGAYYNLVGRDVNATIHALSTVNKVEVLSRPSVLTRSNQQATVLVGQRVPTVTGSEIAATTGAITNIITYQNVGVILRVTPFITADGYVEMILDPEISSISATTIPIGNGQNSPVIDTRAADTVVVTKSDRTVVIGGLISNEKNDVDSKVPILGDIPIIGAAFRRQQHNHTKSELLIFLTPHVVNTPDDLDHLADSEQKQLELAPQAFEKGDMGKFLPGPPKN